MRMILAAAAMAVAVGAAGAASATTFTGTYTPTVYSGGNGLEIETSDLTTPGSGTLLNFVLNGNGASTNIQLFKIWTDEQEVDNSDENDRAITVLFNFTAPGAANGTSTGETFGIDAQINSGNVHWLTPAVINFGGGLGTLTVTLNDATFNQDNSSDHLHEGSNYAATITGHFTLSNVVAGAGAVPEPATWGMMIMGFGMAGATMRRRRSAAVAA